MVYTSKKLIDTALSYVGYLEKASDKDLDDFTANAGSGNYTRFCRDYEKYTGKDGFQPSYWCAEYVSCVVVEAFGLPAAKKLLCGNLFASCTDGRDAFRRMGQYHTERPLPGDIVMFYNQKRTALAHCGFVTNVTASTLGTAEGNTSAGSNVVIDNGGAVATKTYSLTTPRIAGYCRMALDGTDPTEGIAADANIAAFQKWLNSNYRSGLAVDGEYGKNTKRAALKAAQSFLNQKYVADLVVDGIWGPKTAKAIKTISKGSTGHLVWVLQGMLYCLGYDPKGLDGQYGSGCEAAVKAMQAKNFLTREIDGICGPKTWAKLFN